MSERPDPARLRRVLHDLEQTRERWQRARGEVEAAKLRRDQLILRASKLGGSRRTVAAAAGVTNPRVQQIIDRDAGA